MAHRIIIVGGGAGGLELATRLGNRLGRRGKAQITLVDRSPTHIWKPLLHEVAAGSLDPFTNQIEYIAQARWHHFLYQQGELTGLDRDSKTITVSAVTDSDGVEVLPERRLGYDTLVIAIGSVTRFFNVPGAVEHSFTLDTAGEAERFRRRLISACMRAQNLPDMERRVDITLIGAGATGVELSAELRNAAQVFATYGLHDLDPRRDVRIRIIDAAPRILPALPERIANEAARLLATLNVEIIVGEQASEVRPDAVVTDKGTVYPSALTVWAAGIQAPEVTGRLGLETGRGGQIKVRQTLQTLTDPDIFAFGDCASCPWPQAESTVPPRAQAANQQASFLARALPRHIAGEPMPDFHYRDFGSLVSLGSFSAVGNLMSTLMRDSWFIEGMLARWSYAALYRRHLMALHGFPRTVLDTIGQWLRSRTAPRVKLH